MIAWVLFSWSYLTYTNKPVGAEVESAEPSLSKCQMSEQCMDFVCINFH